MPRYLHPEHPELYSNSTVAGARPEDAADMSSFSADFRDEHCLLYAEVRVLLERLKEDRANSIKNSAAAFGEYMGVEGANLNLPEYDPQRFEIILTKFP